MDLDAIKARAGEAVRPLKQPSDWSNLDRTSCTVCIGAVHGLGEAHFVLALLVDLLGYEYSGRGEKRLWSIPVELNDTNLFIEDGKFGMEILAPNIPFVEDVAREVVNCIDRGIQSVRESVYFEEWIRECAGDDNAILASDSILLHDKFLFFREEFQRHWVEFEQCKSQNCIADPANIVGRIEQHSKCAGIREKAAWIGQSAIDCFFFWTEHIFMHLAVLLEREEVNSIGKCNKLIKNDWKSKYKSVFDTEADEEASLFLHTLTEIRESRNFTTHGRFGQRGERLWVPTRRGCFPYNVKSSRSRDPWCRLNDEMGFTERESLQAIERFIEYLWSGARQPARMLLQETPLPLIERELYTKVSKPQKSHFSRIPSARRQASNCWCEPVPLRTLQPEQSICRLPYSSPPPWACGTM